MLGMALSFMAISLNDINSNALLEGGAVVTFIGFLLYALRILWTQNQKLHKEIKDTMAMELKAGTEINKALTESVTKLNEELTTRRAERRNGLD